MSLNRLRELFQSGQGAVGTFVSMGNESVVECLGYTGWDFVIIDTEHGPFDTETMMQLIRAAERVGLVPVVRIANVDHKEIQRAAEASVALSKGGELTSGNCPGRRPIRWKNIMPIAMNDSWSFRNAKQKKPWNKSKKSPPWKASMASLLALSICRHPWAFRDDSHILISWQRKRVS